MVVGRRELAGGDGVGVERALGVECVSRVAGRGWQRACVRVVRVVSVIGGLKSRRVSSSMSRLSRLAMRTGGGGCRLQ